MRYNIFSFLLLAVAIGFSFTPPERFDIVIQRDKVVGKLVYGTIFLNDKELGAAFENDDLKIPAGTYKGIMRYNSGKNFVLSTLGKMSKKGDFLLEVSNVPNKRTDILLHPGTLPNHSKGCILLGPARKGPNGAVTIDDTHPLRKLRLEFYGTDDPISSPNKDITITIKE